MDMNNAELVERISSETIQQRVRELADEINEKYKGKDVVCVCVLKGAYVFFSDVVRLLDMRPVVDFIRLSSYGNSSNTSGKILFSKDLEIDITDKHVIVFEDIVDTGRSMEFLMAVLKKRGPASVRICALLKKDERSEVNVHVDYCGFPLTKGFVVGYGLDYAERYRELPGVYELVE
jgi:hypoxanthine phosphoribosyltransferase